MRILIFLFILINFNFAQNAPYVILISLDGYKWDFMGKGHSPVLDSLAESGVKALSLQPVYPSKTFPNHYSIVTGMYAENHGLLANSFGVPYNKKYFALRDTVEVRNGFWYWGEPIWQTLEKNGITAASYFWPGSDMKDEGRHPTYNKKYDHYFPYKSRVDSVIAWLRLPHQIRPKFITMYFDKVDTDAHKYGPDAPETYAAVSSVDSVLKYLFDGIKSTDIKDSINLVVLSDHGMTEISADRIINIEEMLPGIPCVYYDSGPFMHIATEFADSVVSVLRSKNLPMSVYKTDETPGYYHIGKHPYLKDVLVMADMGWSLVSERSKNQSWLKESKGNHGYDNYHPDMHGIFVASGPLFKKNYKTGTLRNIDIYSLFAHIYRVKPFPLIDGDFNSIGFILKEKGK